MTYRFYYFLELNVSTYCIDLHICNVYKESICQQSQFAEGYRRKHNTENLRRFQMPWLFVASSHDIIKIPRTVRFIEILVEIDSREMQTCDVTDLKISVKIQEKNRERIPIGQQLHRVKILTTKPEDLADRDLPEDVVTFQEVLRLTNIFSIQVNTYKKIQVILHINY